MSLQGLPDYQRPLHGLKYQIYHPFEKAGSFVVASSVLEIGSTKAGRPDFLLEMVRGVSPTMPPKPCGTTCDDCATDVPGWISSFAGCGQHGRDA